MPKRALEGGEDDLPSGGQQRAGSPERDATTAYLDELANSHLADGDGFYASQGNNPLTPKAERLAMRSDAPMLKQPKSFADRVHGQIQLEGLLVAVMDTPEFQRLDKIQQLGGCAKVYPSATHTRKEHSIGVAYLAGYMVRHLQTLQPKLGITRNDILCVELAGLVHDLGHGPFSHMFETFMKERAAKRGEVPDCVALALLAPHPPRPTLSSPLPLISRSAARCSSGPMRTCRPRCCASWSPATKSRSR